MPRAYKLEYTGEKIIEQNTSFFCQKCRNRLQGSEKKLPFKTGKSDSMTCSGCSKVLRRSNTRGKMQPDYASTVITILEKLSDDHILVRHTRTADVETKAGGAVKMSRGVAEPHDTIQAHIDKRKDELGDQDPKDYLMNNSNLGKAVNTITKLPNYTYKIEIHKTDEFVDMSVLIHHVNAPSPT